MSNKRKNDRRRRKLSQLQGLKPAIRMKGGVRYDFSAKGFIAIVHSWDNERCVGEPQEWRSPQVFPTEEIAMEYYKNRIRPELEQMSSKMAKSKNIEVSLNRIED